MTYFLLFFISLVSGLLIFVKQKELKPLIPSLLSFSGAYLLGVCFLHLLPELFEDSKPSVGLFLLIGFFLQLILDYFSGGIEHGHSHVNHHRIGKFPFLVFFSLAIHAFLEAFPINEIGEHETLKAYLIGLLIHKAPISFVLGSLLLAYKLNVKTIVTGIALFSLCAPLGVYVGSTFQFTSEVLQNLLALSIGIILHLSTTILLENNEEHTIQWKKIIPLLTGVFFALISLLFH